MKHLLLILLFVPLISFGQKRTVTDLGVEIIEFGEIARYIYDGNPFNDNQKSLRINFTTQCSGCSVFGLSFKK